MPTATSTDGFTLTNLGPLTTTYTAPTSCSTALDHVFITQPEERLWYGDGCELATYGDCVPSGSAIDARAPAVYSAVDIDEVYYHSPGIACPANWATVGVVAKASNGSFSSTGVFSPTALPTSGHLGSQFGLNVLMSAMDPGETAVVCCPR